jgi:chromosome partitioning protein
MAKIVDLVGTAEVAEMLGITKQTLSNWRTRNAEFPSSVAELRSGPVWRREDIVAWAASAGIQLPDSEHRREKRVSRKRNAVVVAVVNMKGGVGKSTITANLGWHSAYKRDKKVLLVDLDPQFNLSQYALGSERYQDILKKKAPTIYEIFEQTSTSPLIRNQSIDPLDAICNVREWADGSKLDLVPSRLDLAWTLKNSSYGKAEHLANFLNSLRKKYDLILVDCPPTQSMLTDAAYQSSDFVLIPVKPEFLSTIGLPLLVKSLEDFKLQHRDSRIQIAGILFNAISPEKTEHQKSKADVVGLAKRNKWYVFRNEIGYSDSYPKGSREGKPIFLTGYARANKVNEFEALADEFSQRIGL